MRTATDSDHDRESSLDRDASREPRAFSFPSRSRPALTGRGTLQALLLERTEPDVNAAGILNAWRPSDGAE
jgi:hypothetical protein